MRISRANSSGEHRNAEKAASGTSIVTVFIAAPPFPDYNPNLFFRAAEITDVTAKAERVKGRLWRLDDSKASEA
jgi:hypothetical protein